MNTARLWLGCCCLVAATVCLGADVGTVTIVDGKPRLLRGTTWFRLVEGTLVRDADVLEAPEKAA